MELCINVNDFMRTGFQECKKQLNHAQEIKRRNVKNTKRSRRIQVKEKIEDW